MKILITGERGQLAWELKRVLGDNPDYESYFMGRDKLDIVNKDQVESVVFRLKPEVIINSAAYTAVDKAEEETIIAYAVNRDGIANLAKAATKCGAHVIHISTDFVFNGKNTIPYDTDNQIEPINTYGLSKAQGEIALFEIAPTSSVLIRTSWLYSSYAHNFVKTMLSLMKSKDELSVVCDQVGSPTWAAGLANCIVEFCKRRKLSGIYHFADKGAISWYDFAVEIQKQAKEKELLENEIPIIPISSDQFPTKARRPTYSVLDCAKTERALGIKIQNWDAQLSLMLDELKAHA